jgi:glucose/arabinose dehydrogenase
MTSIPARLPCYRHRSLLFILLALGALACPGAADSVTFRDYFGLSFNRPVVLAKIPGSKERYLVAEQGGTIRLVRQKKGAWKKSDFASIKVMGGRHGDDERGLLGLAFHPRFAQNRLYYVNYISPQENTVVAERRANEKVTGDTGAGERVILRIEQPYENHNGGTIAFGPDGYLYVGMGDGGGGGDPNNHAQDPGSLLGKMLRIDVDQRADGKQYGIPPGNPFVDKQDYLPEIWALGLRNPWKWTFRPGSDELWVGDVGQRQREEISIVPRGGNMGWRRMEADLCFRGETCDKRGLVAPLVSLSRAEAASVTGGEFFTASPRSRFHGAYVFGDYERGTVWALRRRGGGWEQTRIGNVPDVGAFSRDSQGRLFALGLKDGVIRLIEFP